MSGNHAVHWSTASGVYKWKKSICRARDDGREALGAEMLPKRHRRSISVNDRQFFWHFTKGRELDHRRFPQLAVQSAEGGALLIVRQAQWPDVTPSFVLAAIAEARAAGWQAADGWGQFVLNRIEDNRQNA